MKSRSFVWLKIIKSTPGLYRLPATNSLATYPWTDQAY
jgi:hypothetical protein